MEIITLTIKQNYRKVLTKGEIYTFDKDVNVIVGDNGSGKSSLLTLLRSYLLEKNLLKVRNTYMKKDERDFKDICDIEGLDSFDNYYEYDAEVDTGKLMDMNTMLEFDGMYTKDMSSGQGDSFQLNKLLNQVKDTKNNLLILDEIDKGLSLKQRMGFASILKLTAERLDTKIIAVSHGESMLTSFDSVISMDEKKWIDSELYYMSLDSLKLTTIEFLRSLKIPVAEKLIDNILKTRSKTDYLEIVGDLLEIPKDKNNAKAYKRIITLTKLHLFKR